jgi:hypothetical protein
MNYAFLQAFNQTSMEISGKDYLSDNEPVSIKLLQTKTSTKEQREPCMILLDRSEAFEVKVLAILKAECQLWLNILSENCQVTLENWFLLSSPAVESG